MSRIVSEAHFDTSKSFVQLKIKQKIIDISLISGYYFALISKKIPTYFMKILHRLYQKYGKRNIRGILIILLVVLIVFITGRGENNTNTQEIINLRVVDTEIVSNLNNQLSFRVIGNVRAIKEARIQTETSGRITNVPVSLGEELVAGTVIARIENATEYAKLLQAQGSYESSLAQAQQSDLQSLNTETNLLSTQNSAVNTYRSTFTSADDIVKNLIDELFSDTDKSTFGLRIDGDGDAPAIVEKRIVILYILEDWSNSINTVDKKTISNNLQVAKENLLTIQDLTEDLSTLLSQEVNNINSSFTSTDITSYKSRFLVARTTLNTALQNIENTLFSLDVAETSYEKSKFISTQSDLSTANAQVKQALGNLRLAQADYAKTLIKTPISGTLNTLNVNIGDYINSFIEVAIVANNNAFEITTYLNQKEREFIVIGDSVVINNSYTGTITNIAPALNSQTKKIEVIIQSESENIVNGDSVSITFDASENKSSNLEIFIPITAVKFSAEDGFVMQVKNSIVSKSPVVLGRVQGSEIEILEGLTQDMEIIIDTRGVNEGEEVEVNYK